MKGPLGPWNVTTRLTLAMQARRWVKAFSLQATGYYLAGVEAPAVIEELADVHARAVELGGFACLS